MAQHRNADHIIVAVHITNRVKQATVVQSLLSEYGGSIKTRVGLHEPKPRGVSPNGVILLELVGSQRRAGILIAALNAVRGVEAKSIVFEH